MMLGMLLGKNARTSNRRLPRNFDRTTYHDTSVHNSMVTVGATSVRSRVFTSAVAPCGLVKIKVYASNVTRPTACGLGTA